MSDDISIPRPHLSGTMPGEGATSFTHSYRSRRTGMDRGTKRLLLAASALTALLVGGMAVWTFTGHPAAGVPTIAADSRPTRIKPENPGGMTAIGVGEQPAATRDGAGDLAPAAEQPDPQALLAQRRAAAAPALAPATVATTPAPTAGAAAPVPTSVPTPVPTRAPATAARPAAPAATMSAAPAAAPGSDVAARRPAGPMVQLAAVTTEAGATIEWQRLSHKLPDLLGGRKPLVERTEQNGRAFWRLRTGGFADMADATEFCKRVRAKGLGCSLATF